MFNVVFFVVLTSVLLQGRSLMLLARWLGVDEPLASRPRYPLEFDRTEDKVVLQAALFSTRDIKMDRSLTLIEPDGPTQKERTATPDGATVVIARVGHRCF